MSILLVFLTEGLYEFSCRGGGHVLLSPGYVPCSGIVGLTTGLCHPAGFVAVSLKIEYTVTVLFPGGVLPCRLLRQPPDEAEEAVVGSQEARV